jgi:cytochrome P450
VRSPDTLILRPLSTTTTDVSSIITLILRFIPRRVALWLHPVGATFMMYIESVTKHIVQVKQENLSSATVQANPRSSVFRYIVSSKSLPPEEQSVERLSHEGATLLGAGALTLARSLSTTFYHILANPEIQETLRTELREYPTDPSEATPKRTALERLPFLRACVREGLRYALRPQTK